MSEEYGNDFVTLIDEDGNEVEFEHIDTVEYEGVTYLAFIPAELSVEEDAEVVIMQVVTDENGEELLEGVEDDDIADAVFNIVMERAEAEDEEQSPPGTICTRQYRDKPACRLIGPALFDSGPFLTHIFSTGFRKVLMLSSRPPGYTRMLEAQRYQTENPPA